MRSCDVAILVMAGGRSRRFGAEDKLLADLDGRSLGLHVAERFAGWDWAQKQAVAQPPLAQAYRDLGYTSVEPGADNGLGDNLALGARDLDAKAVLILLADMPFVSTTHVRKMLEAASSTAAIVCSRSGDVRSPPVLIGRDHFAALSALTGDTGARALFDDRLVEIEASSDILADIDTQDDLKSLR